MASRNDNDHYTGLVNQSMYGGEIQNPSQASSIAPGTQGNQFINLAMPGESVNTT